MCPVRATHLVLTGCGLPTLRVVQDCQRTQADRPDRSLWLPKRLVHCSAALPNKWVADKTDCSTAYYARLRLVGARVHVRRSLWACQDAAARSTGLCPAGLTTALQGVEGDG